jgi:hypothetical protein
MLRLKYRLVSHFQSSGNCRFQRNPPGRGLWLFFHVARSTRMNQIWAPRSRLEKQSTGPAAAHVRQLKGLGMRGEDLSRRDSVKVAQHKVLG